MMQGQALSVVVASGAGGAFLGRCLDSLCEQALAHGAEVIVVDRCGDEVADRIERDHPFVTPIRAGGAGRRPSVPELRAMGVERARGDIVAIIEEHCVAPPHWIETILNSFREGDAAIGGPILDHGYARNRDWVVYFSEYHNYLPPWPAGERMALNGANVAYRRDAVLRHREVLGKGYWEVELHPLLAREGAFRAVPEMGVHHTGPFDYGYYLRQRYLLSRVWGGMQRGKVGTARRLAYLVTAPALPFLLLARVARRVRQSGRYGREFRRAAPLLIPVFVVYVWGESTGYLLGSGRALELVE
jgi:glycosyltransferase involved in cell wall biosynthesis